MSDKVIVGRIHLAEMKFFAYHGVSEQERIVGNQFVVNLSIDIDIARPMHTDHVDDTISYADLYVVVAQEMSIPSDLLEAVTGRILHRLIAEYPQLLGIRIELSKCNPPMGGDIAYASVQVGYGSLSL